MLDEIVNIRHPSSMKIITPGKVQTHTHRGKCGKCGCEFEYADEDVDYMSYFITTLGFVKCPQEGCGRQITHGTLGVAGLLKKLPKEGIGSFDNECWWEEKDDRQRVVVALELPTRVDNKETLREIQSAVLSGANNGLHEICNKRGLYELKIA